MTRVAFAEIGEVEATLLVEYQIIRCRKKVTVNLFIEQLRLAGLRVDALHVPELVVRMRPETHGMPLDIATAAIVAEIEVAVGPDRQPIRPPSALGEHAHLAVRRHPRAALIANFRQGYRTVGASHGALRKAQTCRQDAHVSHIDASFQYRRASATMGLECRSKIDGFPAPPDPLGECAIQRP